jgi:hypothetical protein
LQDREFNIVTRALRILVDELATAREKAGVVTYEQLAAVLSELLCAGELLRGRVAGAESDYELRGDIAEYRYYVKRLRALLPGLQAKLLTERAQLESERACLEAAATWARAARKTST